MIHRYKNNGYNIVLDVNSGSVHVVDEIVYDLVGCLEEKMPKAFLYVKFIIFNVFYISALIFAPAFLYTGKLNRYVIIGLWIGGQIGFYVYDYVYCWFMNRIWVDFRKKIL